jgi:hypothetical protein
MSSNTNDASQGGWPTSATGLVQGQNGSHMYPPASHHKDGGLEVSSERNETVARGS